MRLFLVIAVLLFSFSSSAGAACNRNEHGVFEDPACASEALAIADKELNIIYKRLVAQVDAEAKTKLRASQRAWLAYRKSDAGLAYAIEGNGSAGRMVWANLSEQATQARIKELKSWLR